MKKYLIFWFLLLTVTTLFAQTTYIPTENEWAYHYLDRLELKKEALFDNIHTSVKPYSRQKVAETVQRLNADIDFFNAIDRVGNFYLMRETNEWKSEKSQYDKPLLKYFYRYKSDFLLIDQPDFTLKVNPVLHLEFLKELDNEEQLFQNTRGVEIRGMISQKLGFYSIITENQARWMSYAQSYIRKPFLALPGENRFTSFKNSTGVDFLSARGYLTFEPIRHIQMQFGHDRHFIGNGERSLLLSDFAGSYMFFKINTQVWKFHYTNLFMELTEQLEGTLGNVWGFADGFRGKKYAAIHHLSLNASSRLNIGFFEAVLFDRSNGFEWNYLNPIIFYRAVETQLGSPDNILLGADFKWNPLKKLSVYGQFILDEFNFESIRNQDGDWRNKSGFQLGVKTIDLFNVSGLDIQAEYNEVRPYTYAHLDSTRNYTHYNQPLAHPLGANFREGLLIFRYQMRNKIQFNLKNMYAIYGGDNDTTNWGQSLFANYNTREQDKGNYIGQGIENNVWFSQLTVSYPWRHNIFIDVHYVFRRQEIAELEELTQSHTGGIGIRMNIGRKEFLF